MSTPEDLNRRAQLTFSQAEGLTPLPSQMRPKEVSKLLRALLWDRVLDSLQRSSSNDQWLGQRLEDPWRHILFHMHIIVDHGMADEFNDDYDATVTRLKSVFQKGDYAAIFDFLQFILRHADTPYDFEPGISGALEASGCAYRVFDRKTIAPVGNEHEAVALGTAFTRLRESGLSGANKHLSDAAGHLSAQRYAECIREAVHAVESVARLLTDSGLLSDALTRLRKEANVHPALERGFNAIYGYTNDREGIRHPLLNAPTAEADEADAMFMLGACAAFVTYLLSKGRAVDLLSR